MSLDLSFARGSPYWSVMDQRSRKPVSIAYYCTGHGFGHATRSIEVVMLSAYLTTPCSKDRLLCAFEWLPTGTKKSQDC